MINSSETLAQKFVKKGFWLYFFTFLIGPLGYIIKMIISHDLSVAEVGIIYGIMSFVGLLGAFNDLGCTESLNYFLPKYLIQKDFGRAKYLIHITLKLQLISSIVLAIFLFFLAPWLAINYFHEAAIIPIIEIIGLYFIGINLFHFTSVFFSVSQNTKLQKGIDLIRLLTVLIGTIILSLSDLGNTYTYILAWIIGVFIGCIFGGIIAYNIYYKIYFKNITEVYTKQESIDFFKYAGATMLTTNIGMLLSQVDTQLILLILGPEANGYYSNYLSLLNIPFILITPIVSFLFPVISELHSRDDTIKMKIIHKQFSLYLSILGIWIGVFLFQFGEPLAVLFFGEKFRESGNILGYSSFFLIFNLLIQIQFQFLAGTGRIGERAKILLIILPVNILLNFIFIHLLGVHGSALAVGLSWIPLWYLSYRVSHNYGSSFDWIALCKNIILSGISFGIMHTIITSSTFQTIGSKVDIFFLILIAFGVNMIIFVIGNFGLLREAFSIIRKNK